MDGKPSFPGILSKRANPKALTPLIAKDCLNSLKNQRKPLVARLRAQLQRTLRTKYRSSGQCSRQEADNKSDLPPSSTLEPRRKCTPSFNASNTLSTRATFVERHINLGVRKSAHG